MSLSASPLLQLPSEAGKERCDGFRYHDQHRGKTLSIADLEGIHLHYRELRHLMNHFSALLDTMVTQKSFNLVIHAIMVTILFLSLSGCGPDGGEGIAIATPTGATASLAWDPVQDPSVTSYQVHYGKQPSGQSGSCSYEEDKTVTASSATITGLDPNTQYFFAVSAYNGLQGACSNEVSLITSGNTSFEGGSSQT